MSREYARRRRGGGFPVIIAIIGTLIVITVAVFIFTQCSDTPIFGGGGAATPTPTLIPMNTATPTPSPTPEPTPEEVVIIATPTPDPDTDENAPIVIDQTTPTPSPTPAPHYESARVWASALTVRSGPGTNYEKIGKAKYGDSFEVFDETSRWIKIRFNNTYGWIWEAYTARGNEPLPPKPTPEPDPSLLKSASVSGNTVTVKFTEGVYGNEELTEALAAADFTVKEGSSTVSISAIGHTAGSDTATLTIGSTSGGDLTISIEKNSVYGKESGESGSGSVTTGSSSDGTPPTVSASQSGNDVTFTFSEAVYSATDGTGALDGSDFNCAGADTTISVSHSAGSKTATVTVTTSQPSGTTFSITLLSESAFDAAGNKCNQKSITFTVP